MAIVGGLQRGAGGQGRARPDGSGTNESLFHIDARRALDPSAPGGWSTLFRRHHWEAGYYSWWDYQMLGFAKNRGLRIDHIFATEPLARKCDASWIDCEARKGQKPSDHAPVLATFA